MQDDARPQESFVVLVHLSKWGSPVHLNRRTWIATIAAIVVIVLVVIVAVSRGDSKSDDRSSTDGRTSTTVPDLTGSTSTSIPSTTTLEPAGPFTTPDMPLNVEASGTSGLRSGDRVTVQASPKSGSQLFGVEARLCRGGVAIDSDAEFTPTRGGNCIVSPLAPGTDAKVLKAGEPPYGGLDVGFIVGTGTDSFLTQFDGRTSVTCDAQNPCQIVLKLQYPNGFGFMGVPVTFG